jgi:hypothetical protein
MTLSTPELWVGALCLGLAILYGAWHEGRSDNARDAKVLGAIGLGSVVGAVAAGLYW